MNFLILGCSWGVPNYSGQLGDPVETHTEFLLQTAGHNVINCCINGGSNLSSLKRAKLYLARKKISRPAYPTYDNKIQLNDTNIKIDWTIWFQTEFLRDEKIVQTRKNLLETIAQKTYLDYQDFFKSIGTKVALIGGNSDLHPCYKKYLDPDFVIESWSSNILGQEPTRFDPNDPELEFKFIDNELRLQKLKSNSILFPDKSHPGAIAHAKLVEKILECVTKENSQKN
jgi:hypothetical protein